MKVQFYSRGPVEQVSGGFHYNQRIIDYLRQRGVDVDYHPDKTGLDAVQPGDVVIVDSLVVDEYFDELLNLAIDPILFLHMVPQRPQLGHLLRRSRIIGSGEGIRESLQQLANRGEFDITIIEPGIAFAGTYDRQYAKTARRLLYLANYLPGKGHIRALDILATLRNSDWTLDMHGNQALEPGFADRVRAAVSERQLDNRVNVGDAIPYAAVQQTMAQADLLLNLSEYETYSMINAEAIACGLPVCSTRVGNWRQFAESGLVHFADADDASATATLATLIDDPAQYAQLRPVGDWQVRSWETVGAEFYDWLQSHT